MFTPLRAADLNYLYKCYFQCSDEAQRVIFCDNTSEISSAQSLLFVSTEMIQAILCGSMPLFSDI